jgi:hypothetical protein
MSMTVQKSSAESSIHIHLAEILQPNLEPINFKFWPEVI